MRQAHADWFHAGAQTLRTVARTRGFANAIPTDEEWYLCPLCLDVLLTVDDFTSGELTVEHVPPKALGGRELVLTCKRCNNDAGSSFDAEADKQQQLLRFLTGQSGQPQTAAFTVADITTRVEMHVNGQTGMLLVGVPHINNPTDVDRLNEHLRAVSETRNTEFRFSITPQLRYSPDRARVSWIRTAYLAAFALFGWTYILQPALHPIREQLRNPSTITLPLLSMYNPDIDPDRHELWVIKQPAEHHSLLAIWGRHGVFLPLPNSSRTLDELASSLGARTDEPVRYSLTGDMYPWPAGPMHLLDQAQASD